jgi:plastocyanin
VKRALRISVMALVLSGLLATVAPAGPEDAHVTILYSSLTPTRTVVLAGDTVHWLNGSIRNHTVTSRDGLFDSGVIPSHSGYSRLFDSSGTYLYACVIHPSIAGEVDVFPLLLSVPASAVLGGSAVTFSGRAQAGIAAVTIERQDPGGPVAVTTATVGADGNFTAQVRPDASAAYRAVSGSLASPDVQVNVTSRRDLSLSAKRSRRGTQLRARVLPPEPGARVALQLFLRERFGWWTVAQVQLDKDSRARFRVQRRGSRRARVVLLGSDGVTATAVSPSVRFRNPR